MNYKTGWLGTFILFAGLLLISNSCKNTEEVAKSSEKTITDLKIDNIAGADVKYDAASFTYTITLPRGTDLKAIPVNFTIPKGATCAPKPGTVQNFSQPVSYTITAEDGSKQVFKVAIQTVKSNEKLLSALKIEGLDAATVSYDAASFTFKISVPGKTDIKTLKPVFSLSSGASSTPASGVIQDLTNPVSYTVTAEDGSTQQYRFVAEKRPVSNEALITAFSFKGTRTHQLEINHALSYVNLLIFADGGVELASLEPQVTVSKGASVSPSGILNFSPEKIPLTLTVTAEDGITKKQYGVYVNLHFEPEYWSFDLDGVAKTGNKPSSSNYHRSLAAGGQSQFQSTSIYHVNDPTTGLDWQLDLGIHGTSEESPLAWGRTPAVPLELTIVEKTSGISARMNVYNSTGTLFSSDTYSKENAGKITFTRVDKYFVEGTFEGFAKNINGVTIKITNGKFRVRRETYTPR